MVQFFFKCGQAFSVLSSLLAAVVVAFLVVIPEEPALGEVERGSAFTSAVIPSARAARKRFILLTLLPRHFSCATFCPKNACQAPKPPNPFAHNNIRVAF
jgi:hypothetical protein